MHVCIVSWIREYVDCQFSDWINRRQLYFYCSLIGGGYGGGYGSQAGYGGGYGDYGGGYGGQGGM